MSFEPYTEGEPTPFTCPSCLGLGVGRGATPPLRAAPGAFVCPACARSYPLLGGVPCLMPEPERFRFEQLQKVRDYSFVTETRQRQIGAERRQPDLILLTRERLLRLIHAMDVERKVVNDTLSPLFAGLDVDATRMVPGSVVPARDLSVLEMYETVFRDWAWGEPESERALSLVARLAETAAAHAGLTGSLQLGKLAVFGSGACRLAADVHRSLGAAVTYALDFNPLPLLLAQRVLHGAVIEAFEYPTGPRGLEHTAVLQQLRSSFPMPDGLVLALADARQPPFAAESLNSVLTPWFIDVVGTDLPQTIATIHDVLAPGGYWLNQGPLRFRGAASQRYSIEEVRELVQRGGFELVAELTEDQPYFDSPHAGARRLETVYGFVARKVGPSPPRPAIVPDEPAWSIDVTQPIPRPPELSTLQERLIFTAGALSLIDGTRSLADLAEALGGDMGVQPERVIEPLRSLLLNVLVTG